MTTSATRAADAAVQQPDRRWRDRFGREHIERGFPPHDDEPRMDRVLGALERSWAEEPGRRADLLREARTFANPRVVDDPAVPDAALWTWVVESADARSVLLWTNPVFDHADVAAAELTRLPGSDLWTICLRLPRSLRASYRIAVWTQDDIPPWRQASGRRQVLLAAMAAGGEDPRGEGTVTGSRGEVSSVGAGPDAPRERWSTLPARSSRRAVENLALPGGERASIYPPRDDSAPTPLLVLFDGEVWRRMLPGILDAMIDARLLPPLHVAMLEAGGSARRWENLGVPARQVDTVIDHLLPRVRRAWNVSPDGDDTIVSGQSLGGIAALWTIALSGGEVRHAIAQSPSLWRFDIAEHLAAAPEWRSVELQAGTFEGEMLTDAAALAGRLRQDPRTSGRRIRLGSFEAGHDWAVWRANLIGSLAALQDGP